MKLSLTIIVALGLLTITSPALAVTITNTHSIELESSTNQYLSISDGSQTGLDVSSSITLSAWIKPESVPLSGNTSSIISKWDEVSAPDKAYTLAYQNNAGTPRLIGAFGDGTNIRSHSYNVTLTNGTWYHVAITMDSSGTTAMYLNGQPVGSTGHTAITSLVNSSEDFKVGARKSTSVTDYFDGQIDEVQVWNDVRTSAEIVDGMFESLIGNEANLVGYWSLNNNNSDGTSNNNDLTLSGSPTYSEEPAHEFNCSLDIIALFSGSSDSISCSMRIF